MASVLTYMQFVFTDRRLAGLLAVAGVIAGLLYLLFWIDIIGRRYCVEPSWFNPSVMVACGRGFTTAPNPADVPPLQSFLQQKDLWFLPEQLRSNVDTFPPGPFHNAHRYLLYSVGILWRICGISWGSLKLYLALMLGATAAISFGIFRLGMNRLASTVCTVIFILSPGVLSELPSIRDFAKAPFMLAVILILGYLVKKPVRTPAYVGLAALLGLVLGIGLGFRQDLLVGLLPGVFVVAICGRTPEGTRLRLRAAAVAALAAGFLVPAWPIFASMRNAPSLTGHFLMQGLATESPRTMGIRDASYECVFSNNDNFVHATENAFRRRMNPEPDQLPPMQFWSSQADAAGKQYWARTLETFPADAITRLYGSTLRILKGVGYKLNLYPFDGNPGLYRMLKIESPLAEHLDRFGPLYALVALLLISVNSFWLALACLFLLLCFCGYTSLQFQFRHTFHLGLISLWMLAFVITQAYAAAKHLIVHARHREIVTTRDALWHAAAPVARRMAVFALVTAALLLTLLYIPRTYQHFSVGKLLNSYVAARLEPVDTTTAAIPRWTWIQPAQPLPSLVADPNISYWDVLAEYVVAEFTPSTQQRFFWIGYRASTDFNGVNFSQFVSIPPTGPDDAGTVKCFFPVYEAAAPVIHTPEAPVPTGTDAWSRGQFLGIALSEDHAADFKALYRVANAGDFPLWLGLCLPADTRYFRRCLKLGG